MSKIDIAYIVSHGFAARMVTQTDLLGKLVEQGKRVALISPDKEDSSLNDYCSEKGVELFQFKTTSSFWTNNYQVSRKYFLEDIEENPALLEKHIYATKYNTSKNPLSHIRPRILFLIHKLKKRFPKIKKWYKNREDRFLDDIKAQKLIKRIRPGLLISTYPVSFIEAMLLKAGHLQGVKTTIHLLSWDNITCKGHFPQLADEYIAWGPIMKNELVEYYDIDAEKIHICGVPHFDIHVETRTNLKNSKYLLELGLDPKRPYLFFGMSSPRFAPFEIDIVEWLAAEVQGHKFGSEMQLIVRPHPQNVQGNMADRSWLPRLRSLKSSRIAVDFPDLNQSNLPWSMKKEDMARMSQLLAGCSVSLNSGSTLSIDALMCGVPVVLTSFDGLEQLEYWKSSRRLIDYTHLSKLVKLGGVQVAYSYEELYSSILLYLDDPKRDIKKRTTTIKNQIYQPENGCTQEVVSKLLN